MAGWQWRPRFDADLIQRCLVVVSVGWVANQALGFGTSLKLWLDIITLASLGLAIAKSAIQYLPGGRRVLITGCDTGFGHELAKHLASSGFEVFAGCLDDTKPGADRLRAHTGSGKMHIHVLKLDVTEDSDWDKAYDVVKKTGAGDLWGLVHNAGWSTFGDIEWVNMATFHKIADINIFGLINGTKKMLPLIRASRGRVVTITSGLVRGSAPSRSPYVFTKTAVVGFLECLRAEMKKFGVQVSMIEPGNYLAGTKLFDKEIIDKTSEAMWAGLDSEVKSAYGGQKYKLLQAKKMSSYLSTGLKDLTAVLQSYQNGLLDVFPQVRYQPMNFSFKARSFVYTHLPEAVFDTIYG